MIKDETAKYARLFQSLAPAPLRGIAFYRTVKADRVGSILSTIWSQATGGRYNRKGTFEALYVSDTPTTALFETESMIKDSAGKIKGTRFPPRTIVTAEVTVARSVSLVDPAVQTTLGVVQADLYLPWRVPQIDGPTLTQQLGAAARCIGIECLLVPSEKSLGALNAVVFPDQLRVGSEVRIFEPDGLITDSLISGTVA